MGRSSKSEAQVQAETRLKTSQQCGSRLFRNNVGAFKSPNGQWVRYGLANDSKQMNQEIKSSDLIGWTCIEITPDMVGRTVAVFTSIEVKEEGYKPSGKAKLEHYQAQLRWCERVAEQGGIAGIVDSADKAVRLVRDWIIKIEGKGNE